MISKNEIDFSDDSQISSFGSNDTFLNQDPEEENKCKRIRNDFFNI